MIIKAAKRIFNSDKICHSYSDLNFGVTFLEHSVHHENQIELCHGSVAMGVFCVSYMQIRLLYRILRSNNFLTMDVFFAQLKHQNVKQQEAYQTTQLLGAYWKLRRRDVYNLLSFHIDFKTMSYIVRASYIRTCCADIEEIEGI